MIPVIDRYIIKEILLSFSGVIIVLFVIFMSNRVVRLLADIAAGEIPGNILFPLMGLTSLKFMILVVPLGFYLSILLLLGRLYRDHEMSALTACGVGPVHLYRPVLWLSLPLVLLVGTLTFILVPWTTQLEDQLLIDAQKRIEISGITAGQFRESRDGKRIIYVEKIAERQNEMENVFIRVKIKDRTVLMTSRAARVELDPTTGNRLLVLLNGNRYEGQPGEEEFRLMEFDEHRIILKPAPQTPLALQREAKPSLLLLQSDDAGDLAELHWRMAVPMSIFLLSLLAVPLARVQPRQGQYGKLFTALLVYIIYLNLLAVARTWMSKGLLPPELGLWWVHAGVALLIVVLLVRQLGWRWTREKFLRRAAG